MFICARCGETVTVPYRYQGKVYGYSCVDIVNPGRKSKEAMISVKVAKASEKTHENGSVTRTFKVHAGAAGFAKFCFGWREEDFYIWQDGKLFLPKRVVIKYKLQKQQVENQQEN